MEELSILLTIFVSVGIIVFFISTLLKQYYHRKYKKIQMKDEESIHYILKHSKIQIGSYYTYKHPKFETYKRKIISVRLLHDDNNGGYYIELNNEIIADKHMTIDYNE
jgi:hypothetical protein